MAKSCHVVHENESPSQFMFDWNETQVNLLCFGFVRQHLSSRNIQIDDITTIVLRNLTCGLNFGLIHNQLYGRVSSTANF